MSEYLLRAYRPVADALLSAQGLSVPVGTRDMLANTILVARRLPRNSEGEPYHAQHKRRAMEGEA